MASKDKILAKAKAHRTRPAEIEGEPVEVRVYSGAELQAILGKVSGGKDKDVAEVMAAQFLDPETKEPIFKADWFLSEECTNAFIMELAELFIAVNSGKKKP